jgi:hypothetical protein
MTTKITDTEIRAHFLRRDANKVRITRNGEVHVRGTMPNTNKWGWYFAGFVENIRSQLEHQRTDDIDARAWA